MQLCSENFKLLNIQQGINMLTSGTDIFKISLQKIQMIIKMIKSNQRQESWAPLGMSWSGMSRVSRWESGELIPQELRKTTNK